MTWNILVILTSPTVSANLLIRMEMVHKPGGPRGLLLRGYISSAPPARGCRQMSTQALLWAWLSVYRCLLLENWTSCLYQLGVWHESCQWQGTATCLVSLPSFAQLLWLERLKLLAPGGPTDHPIIRRARHRLHVYWKVTRSVKGKSANSMHCLVDHLLEMSNASDGI